jgi:hypothetical protein
MPIVIYFITFRSINRRFKEDNFDLYVLVQEVKSNFIDGDILILHENN